MCGRTGMSWRRRSTPGSRTRSRGGDDRVCLRRGEGLRSFQGGRETWKTASWQPAGSRIRLPLKESDIPVAVNPKSADGPSNNPQCGFWDSQFSAAQVKSVEQPWRHVPSPLDGLWRIAIVVTPFAFPVFECRRTTGRHGDDYGGVEFHWQQCMTVDAIVGARIGSALLLSDGDHLGA